MRSTVLAATRLASFVTGVLATCFASFVTGVLATRFASFVTGVLATRFASFVPSVCAIALVAMGCGGTTSGGAGDPDDGAGGSEFEGSGGNANSGGGGGSGGNPRGSGGRGAGGLVTGGRAGVGGAGGNGAGAGAGGTTPDAGAGGVSVDAGAGGAAGLPTDAGPNGFDGCVGPVACSGPPCPAGLWLSQEGCVTCACAPPPVGLIVDGVTRPSVHLSLTAVSSIFIGGVDRWVFGFTWDYDDPNVDDEEEQLVAVVRVMILNIDITAESATFRYPSPTTQTPMEHFNGAFTGLGVAPPDATVIGVSGFISVRREGDRFVGGGHLEFETSSGGYPGSVVASGPFDVPVPDYF